MPTDLNPGGWNTSSVEVQKKLEELRAKGFIQPQLPFTEGSWAFNPQMHRPEVCINSFAHAPGEDCKKQPRLSEYTVNKWIDNMVERIVNVPHPTTLRFLELTKEIGDLHAQKSQDYGSNEDPLANVRASEKWGIPAWVGALLRLNDKVVRLQRFARDGELANESAEDSMRDIAVYALIALVLYEEATAKGSP